MKTGLLFASPWIIGFLCFALYPISSAIYYSFTRFNLMQTPRWLGLGNYKELFFSDQDFWISLYNTMYYTIIALPLGTVIAICAAMLLNADVKGMSIYRTIYFLPVIVPIVASAIMWLWILNPRHGMINAILRIFGTKGPPWLASPVWSKPALILMSMWTIGHPVVI